MRSARNSYRSIYWIERKWKPCEAPLAGRFICSVAPGFAPPKQRKTCGKLDWKAFKWLKAERKLGSRLDCRWIRGRKTISIERQVRIGAGSLVFISTTLGWFVHPAFFLLAAFVGAGLVFAGVTDICGMAILLAKAPWNRAGREDGTASVLHAAERSG